MTLLQYLFSIKNEPKYKIIRILGIKFKIIRHDKLEKERIAQLKILLEKLEKNSIENKSMLNSIIKKISMDNCIWQINNTKFYVPNYPFDLIQRYIVNNNNFFEFDVLKILDSYIPQNAVILDIGANIGNHTLYWLCCSSKNISKVYAFEPINTTFKILNKNILLNNIQDKVKLFNFGLSDKTSNAHITEYSIENIGNTCIEKGNGNIMLKKLDDIKFEENRIDFMKIDVEGTEQLVLNGAKQTIQQYKPIIFIEIFNQNQNTVNKFFEENDYELVKEFPEYNFLYRPRI